MESFKNDELDDDSRSSLANEESNMSDFDFHHDELADDLDRLQVLSKYSNENEMDIDSISEIHTYNGGFTSISPKDATPILVFRNYFPEEIFNRIVDQTNIYEK
ncbi:unnamed protein product [Rotaria magnacalcarata]|uniref:Uncharacterized protein n=1 Tax=Rotaria magnacalcarata TaxID=392030 RepID=A0A816TUW6_9BILA|nr:unnamed protein product [Rotaria magnacalcarata]CAF2046764.1 unnamed protein product [Rotaria magnacalcarata]CAF2105685.1 unnamed protein product [Rotaria magnacalcarata]CAF4413554.1 unnamed protein product [Rotaria magnacalcarata]CAF4428020.1 unnamed protein product [Rotaria magnacalcarata]